MHKNLLRSALVLFLVVALLLPLGVTPAQAAYENTYSNTGNMRDDIIGVALTQVGYTEGSNNYTKYGVWYGLPNSPWCGMFVSWCAAQAGIPTSVLKRTGIANPSNFGLSYKSGSSYTPQKGDLFFKSGFTHVGLVYYTEGAYFYTVEGNTSTTSYDGTSVMIRKRKISDFYFSSPNYSGSSSSGGGGCSHSYSTGYEAAHPHKQYQVCSKCGKTAYTGSTTTSNSCTTCIQAACKHEYGQWTKANDTNHSKTCSKCNLTQTSNHDWKDGKILSEATCVADGSQQITCSVCGAESQKSIPATGVHNYGSASYIDDTNHQKICSVCGHQELFQHTANSSWKNDALYHWTSCADCGGRISHNEHTFSGGCLAPCDTCGFTQDSGHKLTEESAFDGNNHWHVCQRCGLNVEIQLHTFTSACDETCNGCGYTRNTAKDHSDEFHADETGHWRVCTSCHRETPLVAHTADRNCEDWDDITCIQCGYVLVSSDRHQHTLNTCFYDASNHWGNCICGEELAPEIHRWDIHSGTCSDCGAQYSDLKAQNKNFFSTLFSNLFGSK